MYYYRFFIIFFLFIIGCTKSEISNDNKNQINDLNSNDECADYVALWSANDIAKELGIDKKWAFLNYLMHPLEVGKT